MRELGIWNNKNVIKIFDNLIYDIYYNKETKTVIIYDYILPIHLVQLRKILDRSIYEVKNIVVR